LTQKGQIWKLMWQRRD